MILDNGEPVENAEGKYGPDLFVERINAFMERHRAEPFFVYYPMALTHGPFNPTPRSEDWAGDDRFRSSAGDYFGDMVEYMDEVVGRIVAKIDELGIRENTLILFFSDNGSPLETVSMMGDKQVKGGKGEPTDAGTRVPLIANWRGTTPAGCGQRRLDRFDRLVRDDRGAGRSRACRPTRPSTESASHPSFAASRETRKTSSSAGTTPNPAGVRSAFPS